MDQVVGVFLRVKHPDEHVDSWQDTGHLRRVCEVDEIVIGKIEENQRVKVGRPGCKDRFEINSALRRHANHIEGPRLRIPDTRAGLVGGRAQIAYLGKSKAAQRVKDWTYPNRCHPRAPQPSTPAQH